MAKWLLVDGFNLVYRCFFAIPELTRSDGLPTNALHGWVKSLWMLNDQEKPEGTLVFFDLGGAQDRLALHPAYKAHREEMPEAMVRQLPYVKALTRAMGFVGIERDGVESDDLLASEARSLAGQGHEVLIVSSDKDFAQMVDDRIKIMLPPPTANPKLGWRRMDAAGVQEKFGVGPALIADYLALVGDTSDNIPGIAGVGPKTASKWLLEFGSLEGVIAHAGELKPERFREPVAQGADRLRRNLKLTTLNLSHPPVATGRTEPQAAELFRLLEELEMKSSLADARKRYGGQAELF
ncbi:MAG TPA: 5'-3' exonuclease H3TH domain-containing protein [Opitutaceae bacterium]|nr:5'-3' exonuclease H3TH domain-containing protein [Opitutaceae bacterium]